MERNDDGRQNLFHREVAQCMAANSFVKSGKNEKQKRASLLPRIEHGTLRRARVLRPNHCAMGNLVGEASQNFFYPSNNKACARRDELFPCPMALYCCEG